MKNDLDNCIKELQKPTNEKNLSLILKYLETLHVFITILQEDCINNPEHLSNTAKIMRYKKKDKNEIIVEEGEKGDEFYLILKGEISVLVSKPHSFVLTEEEYILHLMKLKKNHMNELINQCLKLNHLIYPIDENFDTLLKGLANKKTKGGIYLDNPKILNKAKEVYFYIKNSEIKNRKKYISPNQYIENSKVIKEKLKINEEKKTESQVLIPIYEIVNKCKTGQCFGEIALNNISSKRTATVISTQECHFGIIQRREYNDLIKNAIERAKKNFLNIIDDYKIFNQVSNYILERNYYKLFVITKIEKGINIITEGEICKNLFFICNGEFEIYTCKNIYEVNELIIYYKNYIRKVTKNKQDYKEYNPIKEIRENEDLMFNNKFNTKEQNKILFKQRNIRLNIFKNRDIIGLNDCLDDNCIAFINCKCLALNGEVYYINKKQYNYIQTQEDYLNECTINFEIQKMKMLINRLNAHKELVYNMIKKIDNEIAFDLKKKYLKEKDLHIRNRFYNVEVNQKIQHSGIQLFLSQIPKSNLRVFNDEKKNNTIEIKSYSHRKKKIINLPKIKINDSKKNESGLNAHSSRNQNLVFRNLYDSIFHSYVFNKKNKDEKIENKSLNHNRRNYTDLLIMENFNTYYQSALTTFFPKKHNKNS